MLLSRLTKYLHLKSPKTSPKQPKPSEVTCVQSEEIRNVSSNETVDNCFLRSECAETRSNASEACPHEQNDYVSRDKDAEAPEIQVKNVEEVVPETKPQGTMSHLGGSIPRRVETPKGAMTKSEMREARELFEGLDDAEIHRLYKKVTQ